MTDRPSLSMSNLGSCDRALVAAILGMKPLPANDTVQGWFDRGHAHETECLAAMRADEWWVSPGQEEVHVGDLVGHLDGYVRWPDGTGVDRVVEVKAPSAWSRFEKAYKTATWTDPLMIKYGWQTACYQVATGLECVVACVDDGRVKYFVIETPLHTRGEIEARVAHIRQLAVTGLPDACEAGMVEWTCGFRYLHNPEVVSDVDNPRLQSLLVEHREQSARRKLADDNLKNIRPMIDQLAPSVGKYRVNGIPVTWYETTRTTLDKDAMAADGIDVTKYEKSTKTVAMKIGDTE